MWKRKAVATDVICEKERLGYSNYMLLLNAILSGQAVEVSEPDKCDRDNIIVTFYINGKRLERK